MNPPTPGALWLLPGNVAEQTDRLPKSLRFQLIYWDPPFFSMRERTGDVGHFNDVWPSLEVYLNTMEKDFRTMIAWLAPSGFFALHCDWHASHYLKVIGDRLLGYDNFRNEVIWHYTGRRQPARLRLNAKHDVILLWAKSPEALMHPLFEPWSKAEYLKMKRQKLHRDPDGREWIWGHRGRGRSHDYKIYLDTQVARGRARDDVWELPIINTSSKERWGYPTQKPVRLLAELIALLTEQGDFVADFMAGSGTTGEAALRLGRNVVLGDDNPDAMRLMQERLKDWVSMPEFSPEWSEVKK